MTVYFLSCVPAALRLNGTYAGVIDGFTRRTEAEDGSPLFVEAVPSDNRMGVNFLLDDNFISSPPQFAGVYKLGGDVLVHIKSYLYKDMSVHMLCQTHFCGHLVTLCRQGGVMLCIERADGQITLRELNEGFAQAAMREGQVGGKEVLCIYSQAWLAIVSAGGELVFCNPVKSYSLGDMLGVTVQFSTCAGCVGECNYSYDGQKLTLISGRTVETRPAADSIKHFAFFESILTRGDSAAYLCGELKPRAGELASYLGDFVDVVVPPQKFYERTGENRAAGLVYAEAPNLFRVKFFAADMVGGLVENIREIEY